MTPAFPISLLLLAISPLALTSCPTSPTRTARAQDANPLLGSWSFDVAESARRSAALGRTIGATPEEARLTDGMIRRNAGSVLTFTQSDQILTTADNLRYQDGYRIKASDPSSVTLVFDEGGQTTYIVEGDTLRVKQPKRGYETVYRRR